MKLKKILTDVEYANRFGTHWEIAKAFDIIDFFKGDKLFPIIPVCRDKETKLPVISDMWVTYAEDVSINYDGGAFSVILKYNKNEIAIACYKKGYSNLVLVSVDLKNNCIKKETKWRNAFEFLRRAKKDDVFYTFIASEYDRFHEDVMDMLEAWVKK